MEKPLHVFCCYAREDQEHLFALKKGLKRLQQGGWITIHADVDISPGEIWQQKISHYLNTAQIILLLVSPDFIGSDYCYSKEMTQALERHREGNTYVIPIILRPVHWQDAPFSTIQVLPTGALPVTKWPDRDDAFLDIEKGIRKAIKELLDPATRDTTQQADLTAKPAKSKNDTDLAILAQASTHSSSAILPSLPTASNILEARREAEMFEKDLIFEEYIIKRKQENALPSAWRMELPISIKIFLYGIMWSFLTIFCVFFACMILIGLIAPRADGQGAVLLLLLALLMALLGGGVTCGIYWRNGLQKKQSLILTSNGCIYFHNDSPLYSVRYRDVKKIRFLSEGKKVEVTLDSMTFTFSLRHFKTPEAIALRITTKHKDFQRSRGFSDM